MMKNRWLDFACGIGLTINHSGAVWLVIFQNHNEPHRGYHNLSHLEAMFAVVPQLGNGDLPTAVSLAIWFHDIIYNPTSPTNEGDSAKLMVELLGGQVDGLLLEEAERLILLTKTHQLDDVGDSNGRILLDADLSILGSEPVTYQKYAQAIRQEYRHVPDELYQQGRTAVLNHFLGLGTIYLTEYGRLQWEESARKNLAWELSHL